jgi:hypothetical protein
MVQHPHLPETPILYPGSTLRIFGKHPPRAGKAMVATSHLPETPIVHPWSVQQITGRHWSKRGTLWLPRFEAPSISAIFPGWHIVRGVARPRPTIRAWIQPFLSNFSPPPAPSHYSPIIRRSDAPLRMRHGWTITWTIGSLGTPLGNGYHIYSNTGAGDPINYATPIGTTSNLTWPVGPLSYPGVWKFGVRAFDSCGEEQNVDCVITLILDANGKDITHQPNAPTGLRAIALKGGVIRAEWTYFPSTQASTPTGFHVYTGTGALPSYSVPAATTTYSSGLFGLYHALLTGLSDETKYAVGVRAFNNWAEETNLNVVYCTAESVGPGSVVNLSSTTTR